MLKKIINDYLIVVLGVLVSFILSWYILDSIILALVYSLLVSLALVSLKKDHKKNSIKNHNIEAMYNFVNLMNIQMLSTKNIYESYKSIENYLDIDFANIDNEDMHQQVLDIANDYNLNSFKMYANTLVIYDTDGGNYKQMQAIPTSLCQKTKIYYAKLQKQKLTKFIEVTSLFILWIFIMVIVKSILTDYYSKMMENSFYQYIMMAILLTGSLFYYLTFKEYFKNKIRGM